ncbi:hypothetical protein [Saccharomonospora azurea]|uniref:Uncharacterized protein n=1 Tax=Saccharomonospora azurea NA-128 TaxID=882081 RepID=H8G679_9PSEU|nr:hypothetical protein [Saccharomonospora azurea]EHY87239.1 hypothetical protein SacazDRAFT_00253 [Saccharomonospora azurea NA-128]
MTLAQSAARSVGNTAIGVALLVLVALIWLGLAAPTGIHPFFYFGLIFLGGGAVGLLFAGVGVMAVRSRVPTTADLRFFQGIRRLVLAMWLCAVVADALGILVVLAIAGGQGSTPLGASTLTVAFATAAVTVICAGITSTVMRRVLPTA